MLAFALPARARRKATIDAPSRMRAQAPAAAPSRASDVRSRPATEAA
jgi:hypothetical protein